ncbi:MAG: hypothetical protein HY919_02275 [Elusimicrobia bacterium]|nr:hypothetical protein [Elusimicrobiota bacterium]
MKDKIIYQLSIEDIYEVCEQSFNRKPTKTEIKYVEEKIGDHIAWFDAIQNALIHYKIGVDQRKK